MSPTASGKRPLADLAAPEGDAFKRPALGATFPFPDELLHEDEGGFALAAPSAAAGASGVALFASQPSTAATPLALGATPRLGGAIAPDKENATPAPRFSARGSLEPGSTGGRALDWGRGEAELLRARSELVDAVRAREEALATGEHERRGAALELSRERDRADGLARQRDFLAASEAELRAQLSALEEAGAAADGARAAALDAAIANASTLREELRKARDDARAARANIELELDQARDDAVAARAEVDVARADAAAALAAQAAARRAEAAASARALAAEATQAELDAARRQLARLEAVEAREAGLRREVERLQHADRDATSARADADAARLRASHTAELGEALADMRARCAALEPLAARAAELESHKASLAEQLVEWHCLLDADSGAPAAAAAAGGSASGGASRLGERLRELRVQLAHASEREGALVARLRQAELAAAAKAVEQGALRDSADESARAAAAAHEAAARERRRAATAEAERDGCRRLLGAYAIVESAPAGAAPADAASAMAAGLAALQAALVAAGARAEGLEEELAAARVACAEAGQAERRAAADAVDARAAAERAAERERAAVREAEEARRYAADAVPQPAHRVLHFGRNPLALATEATVESLRDRNRALQLQLDALGGGRPIGEQAEGAAAASAAAATAVANLEAAQVCAAPPLPRCQHFGGCCALPSPAPSLPDPSSFWPPRAAGSVALPLARSLFLTNSRTHSHCTWRLRRPSRRRPCRRRRRTRTGSSRCSARRSTSSARWSACSSATASTWSTRSIRSDPGRAARAQTAISRSRYVRERDARRRLLCAALRRAQRGVPAHRAPLTRTGLQRARACAQQDGEGNLNMLESDWAAALSTLIREFLQEGGSIPAFLAAATLELFRDAQAASGASALTLR